MKDKETVIEELKQLVVKFNTERDWAQFHSPKNLAMGLSIEAAELMEHFLWKTCEESDNPDDLEAVGKELADIFIFTLNIAHRLDLDLAAITEGKLQENGIKYPAEQAKGKANKHTYYRKTDPEI